MKTRRINARLKVLWTVVAMALFALLPLQAMAADDTPPVAAEVPETEQQAETAVQEEVPAESGAPLASAGEGEDAPPAEMALTVSADDTTSVPMTAFTDPGFRAAINKELKRLYNRAGNPDGLLSPDNGADYNTTRVGDLKKVMFISNETDGTNPIPINSLESSAAAYLENVNTVTISAGDINDLTPLLNMPLLYQVWIDNSNLKNADLSVLDSTSFKNLTNLRLRNNGITSERAGALLATGVTTLDLSNNEITDIGFLSAFTKLTALNLDGNAVSSLTPLSAIVAANHTAVSAAGQVVSVDAESRGAGQAFTFPNIVQDVSGAYVSLGTSDPVGATYNAAATPPVMTWPSLPGDSGVASAAFSDTNTPGVTFDGTVRINYQKVVFRVYYDVNGLASGNAPVDETEYLRNENAAVLPATGMTWNKYTFLNWNTQADGEGTTYAPGGRMPVAGNITLFAQWSQNTFLISASAGDNGSITGVGEIKVVEDENYTFRFSPNTGYSVGSVAVDGTTVAGSAGRTEYTFENVSANHSIHVFFAPNSGTTSATSPQTDDPGNIMKWLLIVTVGIGILLVALEYRRGISGKHKRGR
ncbi:MAG TPA: hypothetical protein DEB31_04985 [Clostridiales bacterium]|nr:hypothetical protein [Clostridiales bacterium]